MHPEATSRDGYIIHQDNTKDIPYGRKSSDYSGCGWIAAYNFFKATGRPRPAEELSRQLATGWFKGAMGTGPLRLRRFVESHGYRLHTACTRKKALALMQSAKAGILMYAGREGLHYTSFAEAKNGSFRFFNAEYGNAAHRAGFEEFYRGHIRFPLFYLMVML